MSDKKRRDITLGEMQDECRFRGDNCETVGGDRCKFFEVCATMQTIDKGCLTPIMWNLTDPPRFTQKQMAFWKSWYDIGALTAYHGAYDETIEFYTGNNRIGTVTDESIVKLIPHGEGISLAELFGKETE